MTDTFHCPKCNWTLPEECRGQVDPTLCAVCEDPANDPDDDSTKLGHLKQRIQRIANEARIANETECDGDIIADQLEDAIKEI